MPRSKDPRVSKSFPYSFPRREAVEVVGSVFSDHLPLDQVLGSFLPRVDPTHRGWLQDVTSGVCRWRGVLEAAIASYAKKPPSGRLRRSILLGAYQIVAQDDVVAAKVVSETVDWIKRAEGEAQARFANAILRRIAESRDRWRNPDRALLRASLPEWIWKILVRDHGEEWSEAFARACLLERPSVWVRAREGEKVPGAASGPVAGSWKLRDASSLGELDLSRVFVQDISNQWLVREVSVRLRREAEVLDLCAAPGGKSIGLAWNGMQVTATDVNPERRRLLEENVKRLSPVGGVRVVEFDRVEGSFDLVWVDAPCSSLGLLRRHPEIRWRRKAMEIEGLTRVQRELLERARRWVKPSGSVIYSVCSVLNAEGPDVVAGLDWGRMADEWFLTPQGEQGGDGIYAAKIDL